MSDQQLKTIVVGFRVLVGLVLLFLAVYLVLVGRLDFDKVLSVVAALLGLDRLIAAVAVPVKQNGERKQA